MAERGRKAGSDARAAMAAEGERLQPPPEENLSAEELVVWGNVVDDYPPNTFPVSQAPLLANYCRLAVRTRELAGRFSGPDDYIVVNPTTGNTTQNPAFVAYNAMLTQMAQLATKLRVTNQNRYQATQAPIPSRKGNAGLVSAPAGTGEGEPEKRGRRAWKPKLASS